MGGSTFNSREYASYSKSTIASKSTREIFTAREINADFDPAKITMRESCDSVANPESTAIIIGLDVTGSMNNVSDATIKGVGTLMEQLHSLKPISDPHIMCMGIGDVSAGDRAPLQATQFEADLKIATQLKEIWLENGGGGNRSESYTLPWYFAATKTEIECHSARGKKGYIFTIGDERINDVLTKEQLNRVMGGGAERGYDAKELLEMAEEQYEVYHLMVEQGMNYRRDGENVVSSWTDVLGERAIPLNDVKRIPEVIISTIMRNEGKTDDEIIAAWDNDGAADSVRHSLNINLRNIRG